MPIESPPKEVIPVKRLKLTLLILGLIAVITATGAAALSSLSFDRTVTGGLVVSDFDPDVALRFVPVAGYEAVMTLDSRGEVSLNLDAYREAEEGSTGFNTNALHTIGDQSLGVFELVNNSDLPVRVAFEDNGYQTLTLSPVTGGDEILYPGESGGFYFILDTTGIDQGTDVTGVLTVESY